jgi:hypothetical protein
LTPFPVADALKALSGGMPGARIITMDTGQWDALLSAAYEQGWILLEVDDNEVPVRAYRKDQEGLGS